MKKLLMLLAMLLAFVLVMAACGGNGDASPTPTEPPAETQPEAIPEPTPPPSRDLGGLEITIAMWWVEECTETINPLSLPTQMRWDDRRAMEERYNFRIFHRPFSNWEGTRDNVQGQLLAENRDFHVWVLEPSWFATHHAQGLFAPIPMRHFDGEFYETFNRGVLADTMRDGSPHAFVPGAEVNLFSPGIYWNMRLLEEAGFPRDYPFTLQREGRWTWDTFTDLSRALWRDLDGSGFPDVWPIMSFAQDFFYMSVVSNGASFVRIDPETGLFVNNTNTPEFIEAVQFARGLRDEMLAFHEDDLGEGTSWDAHEQLFIDGHGVFQSAGNFVAGARLRDSMADDYGFVAFPMGPRATAHYSWAAPNFYAIPHFFSPQEVDDIMFALQLWYRPLEGTEEDDWIFENLPNHRDSRSVEETMVNFTRNPALQTFPTHQLMPGLGNTIRQPFHWRVWSPMNPDAAVIIEEGQQPLNAFIERVNAMQQN